mmetsp:Transcript_34614/g.55322  ORF Transcript_34614/g.55322 Transcript_34614/m.55322 type:complete len:279 (-) Transcript_34614:602-1438(-)
MEEDGYWTRVRRIFYMLDARQAFISEADARRAVERIGNGENDEDLIRIRNSSIHPQTGELIFMPLRPSFIVISNVAVDTVMLLAKGHVGILFGQWLNQTYNGLHYYANRNTSNEDSLGQRLLAYVCATIGSVSVALYFGGQFGPFFAVAAADVVNISITRKSEYIQGIQVFDVETGECMGRSRRAGLMATGSCIVARVAAAAPILAGTPLVTRAINRQTGIFTRFPWTRVPVTALTVGLMIQLAVPLTFGIFRQNMVVSTAYLEPSVKGKYVRFNKGL